MKTNIWQAQSLDRGRINLYAKVSKTFLYLSLATDNEKTGIWQFFWLDLVNINVYTKSYQISYMVDPASILRKSTSGRHRPVSYPDGPVTARYRFT